MLTEVTIMLRISRRLAYTDPLDSYI